MTAEVINLRRVRKGRAREKGAATAAENRLAFGRSKANRELQTAVDARVKRHVDNHRLVTLSPSDDG